MSKTVHIEGKGKVVLDDSDFVAAGGEGTIYRKNGLAIKVYNDIKNMIPAKKIQELAALDIDNVISPKAIVRDSQNRIIGFVTKFVDHADPLCQLFTAGFREEIGFTNANAIELVKKMQETISAIHRHKGYLIVDNNEMNFLVNKPRHNILYFIDVNAWQTPSFHASAIMESVRDRLIKDHKWTELSDWFSFGIVAFQIYIGVHPYKGKHPAYTLPEWTKRMDDGISVFNPKVVLPPSCRPLSVIPPSHLRWFRAIFEKNERMPPPSADQTLPVAIVSAIIINETANFKIEKIVEYKESIRKIYSYDGSGYILTKENIYTFTGTRNSIHTVREKTLLCSGPRRPIVAVWDGSNLTFNETLDHKIFAKTNVNRVMERNGRLYAALNDQIVEFYFYEMNHKIIMAQKKICGWIPNSSKVFDGCFYQDMLGSPFFVIPYAQGMCFFNMLKEVKGYRVLNAKAEDNVLIVLAEKNGTYHKFVYVFDDTFSSYDVRQINDVSVNDVNFTKIPNGPCVLVNDDNIEVFVSNSKVKILSNPPIDTSMPLFNLNGKVFFARHNELYSIKMKP
jgi:hypothetical protein